MKDEVGRAVHTEDRTRASQAGHTWVHHLTGVTDEIRQKYRDEVLGTNRDSFKKFADRLRDAQLKVAVFGAKEALEQANAKRGPDEQISVTPLP